MFDAERSTDAFDDRVVSAADFTQDLTDDDWRERARAERLFGPLFFPPLEVLTPVHTVGRGRTNLTTVRNTVFQTDAATPRASFDRTVSPDRDPAVSVHFQPSAYGATGPGTYVFRFQIEAFGRATFVPNAFAGGGTVDAPGQIRFEGLHTITITLRNVPANAETFASWSQTDGGAWNWFSTSISTPPFFPDLVLEQ
ncbi:hypothetical protein ACDF64_15530 [Agromyces sp. MMS24-JH15]|uniref:hypothetical protein n=1 Tax=Agromyces sp. MMS24-JH15 TaxID=3243765 RepID=UPI0037479433